MFKSMTIRGDAIAETLSVVTTDILREIDICNPTEIVVECLSLT